jgi:acyl-CoA synthetase (NDP forming)
MAGGFLPAQAIRRLLSPRSVAIVGASEAPASLGAAVQANLDRMSYGGDVHLINPKRDHIGGRPCLRSPDLLPLGTDAAVLAIPRPAVLETLRALASRQVGAAVIFSSGFAEGGPDGAREQQEIARIAAESGMVVEGPNCLGMVNYVDGVALTFVDVRATALGHRRRIGIISQSGAMAAVVGTMLAGRALGVSCSVSTGNEAASGVEDYLDYLLDEPHTDLIGLIVEQFRQPRRFLDLADRARAGGKRLVLLHPGRSRAARESAATHTGAMAGDYQVMRTLARHHGVLFAEGLEEFGDVLEIASRCETLPRGGTAVLTESGAFKALTLDLCDSVGLSLPALDDANAPALRAALPPFVPVSNPVDLTAQTLVDPDLYKRVLAALLGDPRFGSIIVCVIQADATERKLTSVVDALEQLRPALPVLFAGVDEGAPVPPRYVERLRELGVPYFPTPERALRAVARASAWRANDPSASVGAPLGFGVPLPPGMIPEHAAKRLLASAGIPFPVGRLVATLEEAERLASEIGFPVVLKAQAEALAHKSDAGGVVLGLKNPEELAEGWRRLHLDLGRLRPGLVLDGVLVEKMAGPGIELIIGGRRDPDWGPTLLVGFGGIQAELLADVRVLPPDASVAAIAHELNQLKSSALLRGFRGGPAADVEAVAALVERVGRLFRSEPTLREIDLNPVVVYPRGKGVMALDALMLTG